MGGAILFLLIGCFIWFSWWNLSGKYNTEKFWRSKLEEYLEYGREGTFARWSDLYRTEKWLLERDLVELCDWRGHGGIRISEKGILALKEETNLTKIPPKS